MRMYDIIHKKREGFSLSKEEIEFLINGVVDGSIPDYQISAFLMACYFKGLNDDETAILTECMSHSGDMVDLSNIKGIKVDKHSTGGVGDKTTLVVAPIVAACGVKVAKMSGRGLGFTGGTLDKLESIPGFSVTLEKEKFFDNVNKNGLSVIGQTGNLVPADKKLYALRDVTATVDNIGLIASSIMSKKIASGANAIVLDVKTGSGAFMKTLEGSINLASAMVSIGEKTNRHTIALITDMDRPLGINIGNNLEVIEAVETLKGNGPSDLRRICIELAANMLVLGNIGNIDECRIKATEALDNKKAYEKFISLVSSQGGDVSYIENTDKFKKADYSLEVKATKDGYISKIDTEKIGNISVTLGAGREKKESKIDYSAGLKILKTIGNKVTKGQILGILYTENETSLKKASFDLLDAITISDEKPEINPLVYSRITKDGIENLNIFA